MVMATEIPKSNMENCVFTLEELKQYWRRFRIHVSANNSRRVVQLAIEFGKEMEERKEARTGQPHPLADLIEHKQIVEALNKRGMYTAEDVVSRGVWAIVDTHISRPRLRAIWELCSKTVSSNTNKEKSDHAR